MSGPGLTRRTLLALAATTCGIAVVRPAPAYAGTAYDYPEFPYPDTDYTEAHRGQFHFSPRGGWMNDINAPLYHDGVYHLFFQHNPHGLTWDTMHWGQAVSTDLVHWTQKPIALEPGVHPGDLWSGGGVVDTENTSGLGAGAIVVFTGTNGVRVAYSTDGATTFQSYQRGTPVVTPAGTSRDPKVFRHAPTNRWAMVVWSDNGGNGVDIHTSPNLLTWTFRSRYAADWLLECPDLFPLPVDGGAVKWVMTDASGEYVIGDFDGAVFRPDWSTPQRMDHGENSYFGTFYGGLTFQNLPDGRTVQMVWMPGNRGSVWTGNASFPVQLALRTYPEGVRLTREPIGELAALRHDTRTWSDLVVTGDPATDPLAGIRADTYELIAEFDTASSSASRFGFRLHSRDDGSHDRAVTYDRIAQTLDGVALAPVNGRVRARLLVDRGQLEIFGNDGRLSVTDNVDFDSSPASQGLHLYAEGGAARVVALTFHRLRSAWGVGESTLRSDFAGPWRAVGGAWTDVTAGKQGTAAADAFYLSDQTAGDFTYEADLRVVNGRAAALTFRATPDAVGHYTANIDTDGYVKLWRPGRDIGVHPTPIVAGRTYHLRVVAAGPNLKVYLDHGATPVIDTTDTTYSSGRLGINVFAGAGAGAGVAQHVRLNAPGPGGNLTGPWRPVAGTWTMPGSCLHGRSGGDGFYLSDQAGGDFTYQVDLRVVNGRAAALTFRATPDATGYYTANIDTDGYVKLWRPGQVIAVHPTAIVEGRTYHLRVVAAGPSIRVHLGTILVIDAVDGTYQSGRFGLNVFDGAAEFRSATVSP